MRIFLNDFNLAATVIKLITTFVCMWGTFSVTKRFIIMAISKIFTLSTEAFSNSHHFQIWTAAASNQYDVMYMWNLMHVTCMVQMWFKISYMYIPVTCRVYA